MMKIFYIYLIKRSFYFSLLILAAFGLLDSIFMFLSELENLSEKYTFSNILKYVIFTTPHRLMDFVEGASLLGVMIALGLSNQEGNLNTLRTAGKSPMNIVFVSSIGALILSASLLKIFSTNSLPIESNEKASDVPRKQDLDNWSARSTFATSPSRVSHSGPIKVEGLVFSSRTTGANG